MSGERGPVFVSEQACRAVLTVADVCEQAERTFVAEAAGQVFYSDPHVLRMVHAGESRAGGKVSFRTKGAILPELGVAGFRLGASRIAADGSGSASPLATRLVLLMDIETAAPLALVDEHYNFHVRTAASVGVTLKHLSLPDPDVGIIGVGDIGTECAHVFIHLLRPRSLHLTSRRPQTRARLADALRGRYPDLPVHTHDTVAELAGQANVVTAVTDTNRTLIQPEDVKPGTTLCALGKYEVHPDIYPGVDRLIVDDWEQTSKAVDIKPLVEAGTLTPQDIDASSMEVVTGSAPGRVDATETILLRSEGIGSHDIAIAHHAYTEAVRNGLAVRLP